jgi:hypothetical protein
VQDSKQSKASTRKSLSFPVHRLGRRTPVIADQYTGFLGGLTEGLPRLFRRRLALKGLNQLYSGPFARAAVHWPSIQHEDLGRLLK